MKHLNVELISQIAKQAATAAARRVRGGVSIEDLAQEAWIWVMSHPEKLEQWGMSEDSEGFLYRSLFHYCLDVAQREKAALYGYKIEDNFYYSVTLLRKILPWWFEESPEGPPEESVALLPDRDIALDLQAAWSALPEAHRSLLRKAFQGDPDPAETYQALAVEWECSDDAARMRVTRSLRKLQELLGGERPIEHKERRKVRSNAAARADASSRYGG
jgi:DNA-directed RNA polymerase specialized sigma24 family protein